jgi:AraC family transcriptional activator of pyochelin receptor
MQVTFSAQDIQAHFIEWSQHTGSKLQTSSFETTLIFPPELGAGLIQQVRLRPGLEMTLKRFKFPDLFVAEVTNSFHWPMVGFTSALSGEVRGSVQGWPGDYQISPRQSTVNFFPDLAGHIECLPHQPILQVEISIEPSVLAALVADQVDELDLELQSLLSGKSSPPFSRLQSMGQAMSKATAQVLNCPYHGLTRRLYLESRALELIALQLQPLATYGQRSAAGSHSTLRKDDIDRIHQAKDLLTTYLDNPPSLLELAKQVGLNDYKLKQGFRQVFGTTAFGYLHHYRLEQARGLLEAGHLSVTEVAQTVGYASVTSFSAAFKKKFGMQPRHCKRR